MKLNKDEIVTRVSKASGFTKTDVSVVYDALFNTIKEALINKDTIAIKEFGKFETVLQKGRTGRNPIDGTPIVIEDHYVPKWRPSDNVKASVRV